MKLLKLIRQISVLYSVTILFLTIGIGHMAFAQSQSIGPINQVKACSVPLEALVRKNSNKTSIDRKEWKSLIGLHCSISEIRRVMKKYDASEKRLNIFKKFSVLWFELSGEKFLGINYAYFNCIISIDDNKIIDTVNLDAGGWFSI